MSTCHITPAEGSRRRLRTEFARLVRLFGLWRNEVGDPEPFYSALAAEAAADLDRRHGLAGAELLDLGCGPGYYTSALREAGARVVGVDMDTTGWQGTFGLVQGDATSLPFPTAGFDGVFCSNLLEHVADTAGVLAEIERVLRPGGWVYLSWTNWYSPWGGHEMTPYQYLGPERGPRLYEKRHGPPRKNRMGEGLFAVHVGPTLELLSRRRGLEVVSVVPRYWPWLSFVTSIPGVREVVTWNCLIRMRRRWDDFR